MLEQSFQLEQQYADRTDMCKALIAHLQKIALSGGGATTHHALSATGASPDLEEDSSPSASATNLEHPPSPVPTRSESDPTPAAAAPQQGGYILRREEEVLVPTRVTLTRKRSKKDKRRQPVSFFVVG